MYILKLLILSTFKTLTHFKPMFPSISSEIPENWRFFRGYRKRPGA